MQAEKYWDRWPILTQQALQEHREELIATDVTKDRLYTDVSGGSSGHTKKFYHSKPAIISNVEATTYANSVAAWTPGCRVARLWGAPLDITKAKRTSSRLKYALGNQRFYDCYDIGQQRLARMHQGLTRYSPEVVYGYSGAIFELSCCLAERDVVPTYPHKSIVTSAEMLTDDMRTRIIEVFKKPVFDRYGSREVGPIAFECETHRGLHVAFTHNLVEVMEPAALEPIWEKSGEIIVTTLSEPHFPLIRYQIGDIGVMTRQECTCGRYGAKLHSVQGRSNDVIVKPDGGKIHGLRFTPTFWKLEQVRQFLVIQRTIDHIEIQLVLSSELTPMDKSKITSDFRSQLGSEAHVEIRPVSHIQPLPSGKRAFVVSHLVEEHQE